MTKINHVAIIGAGAMGCLFAAALRQSGCGVTLVARSQTIVDALLAKGIRVDAGAASQTVSGFTAATDYAAIRESELVLVFVKSGCTANAAASMAPFLAPKSLVLTLQNGLGNVETLRSRLPGSQVVAGVTGNGAFVLGPGHIRSGGTAETVIGEPDGPAQPRMRAIRDIFIRAGFPTRISDNVTGAIWTKLMVNVGINPVSALENLSNGEVAADPEAFAVAAAAVREAAGVAAAAKIRLETDDPVAHMRRAAELTAANESSMLQDLRAGRMTEIEAMNGEVERRGRALGLPVPVNAVLASLIRLRQQKTAGTRKE